MLPAPVADLHAYWDHLPSVGLRFPPWSGRPPARVARYRFLRENLTPRIPEAIITRCWLGRFDTSQILRPIFSSRAKSLNGSKHIAPPLWGQTQRLIGSSGAIGMANACWTISINAAAKVVEFRSGQRRTMASFFTPL